MEFRMDLGDIRRELDMDDMTIMTNSSQMDEMEIFQIRIL